VPSATWHRAHQEIESVREKLEDSFEHEDEDEDEED
jgi:hypothetical protein